MSDLVITDERSLEAKVAAGESYEATQLYVGMIGRLRAEMQHETAEGVGLRGVRALVNAGEVACATTVGDKVVDCMADRTEGKTSKDSAVYASLVELVTAFDHDASPAPMEARRAQKLVMLRSACKLAPDSPVLQAIFARTLSDSGMFAKAAQHFALADCPEEYAALIQRWAKEGYVGELDLFNARAVLHLLSIGRADQALALYAALGSPNSTPLDHFVSLVLELLQLRRSTRVGKEGGRQAFDALLRTYQMCLNRDPHLMKVAQAAGRTVFTWAPPQNPMQNMMQNMMKMFKP